MRLKILLWFIKSNLSEWRGILTSSFYLIFVSSTPCGNRKIFEKRNAAFLFRKRCLLSRSMLQLTALVATKLPTAPHVEAQKPRHSHPPSPTPEPSTRQTTNFYFGICGHTWGSVTLAVLWLTCIDQTFEHLAFEIFIMHRTNVELKKGGSVVEI